MKLAAMVVAALELVTAGSSAERLLEQARLTLREAIEKAGPEAPPGTAVAARLRAWKGRTVFQVVFAHGARRVTLTLDS